MRALYTATAQTEADPLSIQNPFPAGNSASCKGKLGMFREEWTVISAGHAILSSIQPLPVCHQSILVGPLRRHRSIRKFTIHIFTISL